jgi:Ser/Thr protein kinase RdoA (MazF antagonist)
MENGSEMPTEHPYVPPQRIGFGTFDDTESAQVRSLVDAALVAFDLDGYSITSLTKHSNVTAHLVSDSGPPLAMRLRTGPSVDGRTEFAWLQAVRQRTSVKVVEPFAEDFESNTRVVLDGSGRPTECALFLWAEGRPLAADLTVENYRELGRMSARLHEFASSWRPPRGLKPLVWDRTIYYEGMSLVITDARFEMYVSRDDAAAVKRVLGEADEELMRLAVAPERIFLHGNIEMWNVLTTAPGELRLLDFEDVMVGAPVLDVAITLFYGRERPGYARLSTAYESGYRSVREWPVLDARQMDLLLAARAAMLLNHALQTERDKKSVTDRLLPLILAAAT